MYIICAKTFLYLAILDLKVLKMKSYLFCFILSIGIIFLTKGCNSTSSSSGKAISDNITVNNDSAAAYLSPLRILGPLKSGKAYVCLSTGSAMAEVDLNKFELLRNIELPFNPVGADISKDETVVYLTDGEVNGKVYAFSLADNAVLWSVNTGHTPCAVTVDKNGERLYVANRFDNSVSVIDIAGKKCIAELPVIREPKSVKLSPDGNILAVANYLPCQKATDDVITINLSFFNVKTLELIDHIPVHNGSQLAEDLCFSPDGKHLYVTHILSQINLPANRIDWGWINSNALTVVDMNDMYNPTTIPLDEGTRGSGNPCGLHISEDGSMLFIAVAGIQEIYAVRLAEFHERLDSPDNAYIKKRSADNHGSLSGRLGFFVNAANRISVQGKGPRYVTSLGKYAYVANYFSGTMEKIDLFTYPYKTESLLLGNEPEMNTVRWGEFYFADATLCLQGWQSCISCHPDGRADGINWDQMNDGQDNPKNTKSLLYSHVTPPSMITGVRKSAELAVRKGMSYTLFSARTGEVAPYIDAYLKSMKALPSPKLVNGELSESAQRGKAVFEKLHCNYCHSGTYYTDLKRHNVGSGKIEYKDFEFDTPTLCEVWRTMPYLYDGRALTLEDALVKENPEGKHGNVAELDEKSRGDLFEYVLSL